MGEKRKRTRLNGMREALVNSPTTKHTGLDNGVFEGFGREMQLVKRTTNTERITAAGITEKITVVEEYTIPARKVKSEPKESSTVKAEQPASSPREQVALAAGRSQIAPRGSLKASSERILTPKSPYEKTAMRGTVEPTSTVHPTTENSDPLVIDLTTPEPPSQTTMQSAIPPATTPPLMVAPVAKMNTRKLPQRAATLKSKPLKFEMSSPEPDRRERSSREASPETSSWEASPEPRTREQSSELSTPAPSSPEPLSPQSATEPSTLQPSTTVPATSSSSANTTTLNLHPSPHTTMPKMAHNAAFAAALKDTNLRGSDDPRDRTPASAAYALLIQGDIWGEPAFPKCGRCSRLRLPCRKYKNVPLSNRPSHKCYYCRLDKQPCDLPNRPVEKKQKQYPELKKRWIEKRKRENQGKKKKKSAAS